MKKPSKKQTAVIISAILLVVGSVSVTVMHKATSEKSYDSDATLKQIQATVNTDAASTEAETTTESPATTEKYTKNITTQKYIDTSEINTNNATESAEETTHISYITVNMPSESTIRMMKKDYYNYIVLKYPFLYAKRAYDENQVMIIYKFNYKDYIFAYMQADYEEQDGFCTCAAELVCGKYFFDSNLYVWKDSCVYSIQLLFDLGMLSESEIKEINEFYLGERQR